MGTTKRQTWRSTPRAKAGGGLAAMGALLITMAVIIAFTAVPARVAFAHGGFPHGDQNCDVSPLQDERATGGWKININSSTTPPSLDDLEDANIAGVTYSITDDPLYTIVDTATNSTGWWLNYSYDGTGGYTLFGYHVKNGVSNVTDENAGFTSVNPGSIEIPSGNSHIVLCFDNSTTSSSSSTTSTSTSTSTSTTTSTSTSTTTTTSTSTTTTSTSTTTTTAPTTTTTSTVPDTTTTSVAGPTTTVAQTTTTTVADTTTTSVGGPSTTTTTVGQTTTTVAGPCNPNDPDCLPNTGGTGNMIAVLLAGIGLLLLGSGLIVLADERRRMMVA